MTEPPAQAQAGIWSRLPSWLAPRSSEAGGTGQMRLIETTVLILVGMLLATATVNDVIRQREVNVRLTSDIATWRAYTGHDYHNLAVDQQLLGSASEHEVVCGNTSPGPPKDRTQLCLLVWGPQVKGRREVHGGWYIPAKSEDARSERYGCFDAAAQGLCPR
jgi:hypothetical protein